MLARHANRTFAIALVLSLALHAALILTMPNPLGAGPVAAAPVSKPVKVRLTSPPPPPASQPEEPKKEEPKEIDLGLDAPAPPSPTWLGFTEYVKQLMAKSTVEQAAFTDDPVAASPPPPTPPAPPVPQPQESTAAAPPVETPAEAATETPAETKAPPAPEATDATKTVAPDDAANAPQPPPPTPDQSGTSNKPADQPAPDPSAQPNDAPATPPSEPEQNPKPDDSHSPETPQVPPDEAQPQETPPDPLLPPVVDTEAIALATATSQPDVISQDDQNAEMSPRQPDESKIDDSPTNDVAAASASTFVEALTELASQALEFAEQAATKKSPEEQVAQTQPHTEAKPDEQLQAAAPNTPPPMQPQPVVAREQKVGAPNHGAQSDRESDPSSIIEVPRDQWQLGKPLAAHGLEVKPRRPTMPILTTLTAWPANPVCKICFDSAGVPKRAMMLRSTGDDRVDAAIEASLYRWRAAGKPLGTLRGEETFDITIRLLINPARKNEDKDDR